MNSSHSLDVLSEVTGLSRKRMQEIWAEVKANMRKLRHCAGPHDFQAEPLDPKDRIRFYTCKKCGGVISDENYTWYYYGLEHGRKG